MHRQLCASCGGEDLVEIVDLGMHPMADTFIPKDRCHDGDRVYPLVCDLCQSCSQVQLRTVIDPHERYSLYDYSYTSSNSEFSRKHWEGYARSVSQKTNLSKGELIVEIGSNDGYLSAQFLELGFDPLGIDPSGAMCELAAKRSIKTHQGLFGLALATELRTTRRRPSLIVANNVVNHANDPKDFALGIAHLLAPGGTFVFELPSWLRTVRDRKFDQIYHEHVSYFTATFARSLFASVGMVVRDVEEVDYHGGSIRVFVSHERDVQESSVSESVACCISEEHAFGLFGPDAYRSFMSDVRRVRNQFLEKVYRLKCAGHRIVCVGAAAKANTFLNYYRLDSSVVDYVTDSSPTKVGKYTPGTRIPIACDEILQQYGTVHAIITSWNLADTLKNALIRINPRVQFLSPYEAEL